MHDSQTFSPVFETVYHCSDTAHERRSGQSVPIGRFTIERDGNLGQLSVNQKISDDQTVRNVSSVAWFSAPITLGETMVIAS